MWQRLKMLLVPTTVARELLAALSGLALILFLFMHMAGNFFLFLGPKAYNAYAEHLHTGVQLTVARVGLASAFVVHAGCTFWLWLDNRRTRNTPYAVANTLGGTDWVKRSMIYTGAAVVLFLLLHLCDFAFRAKVPPASVLNGQDLGLYGLVWNSLRQPAHAFIYLAAVWAVGLHVSNVVSTLWVTLGVLTDSATARVNSLARVTGLVVALGFSAIPVYVIVVSFLKGI